MADQGCEKHGHINCSACADEGELTRLRADVARLTQERDAAKAEVERLQTLIGEEAAWLSSRGYAFESLGLLLSVSNAKIAFGLRQQGKYERVAEMRAKGDSWETIGAAIGWSPDAVERHFAIEAALAPEQEAQHGE